MCGGMGHDNMPAGYAKALAGTGSVSTYFNTTTYGLEKSEYRDMLRPVVIPKFDLNVPKACEICYSRRDIEINPEVSARYVEGKNQITKLQRIADEAQIELSERC